MDQLSFPVSGVCRACGCDDEHACPGGCIWADATATLCSRCAQQRSGPLIDLASEGSELELLDDLDRQADAYNLDGFEP